MTILTVKQAVTAGYVEVTLDTDGVLSLHGKDGYHIENNSPGVTEAVVKKTERLQSLRRVTVADNGKLDLPIKVKGGSMTGFEYYTLTASGLIDGQIYSAGIFDKAAYQFLESRIVSVRPDARRTFTRTDGTKLLVGYYDHPPAEVFVGLVWDFVSWANSPNQWRQFPPFYFGDVLTGVDVDILIPDGYAPLNGDLRHITVSKYNTSITTSCEDYDGPVHISTSIEPYDSMTIEVDVDLSGGYTPYYVGGGRLDDTWKYDVHRSQLATLQAFANDLYAYRNGETLDPDTQQPVFIDSTMTGITAQDMIAGRTADDWSKDEIVSLQSFAMVQGLRQLADATYVNSTIDNVTSTLRNAVDDFVNLAAATAHSLDDVYTQKAFLTHVIQDIATSYSTVTPIISMDVSALGDDLEYLNYRVMREVNARVCASGSLSKDEPRRRGTYNAVGAYVMSMGEIGGTSSSPATIDTGIGAAMIASPILSVQFHHKSDRFLPFVEVYTPMVDNRTSRCIIALSQIELDVFRVDMYARHYGGDDSQVASSISQACSDLATLAKDMGCRGEWNTPGGDYNSIRGWTTALAGSVQAALSTMGLAVCTMLPLANPSARSATQVVTSRSLTPEVIRQYAAMGQSLDVRVDRIDTSSGQVVRTPVDFVNRRGDSQSRTGMMAVRYAGALTGALGVSSFGAALVSARASSSSFANASWNINSAAILDGFSMSFPTVVNAETIPFGNPQAMLAWIAKHMLTPDPDSELPNLPNLLLDTMPIGCYLFAEQRPSAVASMGNLLATASLASWCLYLRKYKTYTITRSPIVSPFAGAAVPASLAYGIARAVEGAMSDDPVTTSVLTEYLGTPLEYKSFNAGLASVTELGSDAALSLNNAFLNPDAIASRQEAREQLYAILEKINRLDKDERTYYL